jgi:hypothetical protein
MGSPRGEGVTPGPGRVVARARAAKPTVARHRPESPFELMATSIGTEWFELQPGDAPLTTNQEWDDVPFQRWYRFKEAFSPLFVRDALTEAESLIGRRVQTCLSPSREETAS